MSIQAFGTAKLDELRISNMTDYMKFMPSVTFQSLGPGFTPVFMRGVASGDKRKPLRPDAERRPVPRRAADHDHPGLAGHTHLRHRARRDAGRSAGHAVRREFAGRHDPHITNKPDATKFSASYDLKGNSSRAATPATRSRASSTCRSTNRPRSGSSAGTSHYAGLHRQREGSMTFPTSGITMTNYEAGHSFARRTTTTTATPTAAGPLLKIDLNDNWSITPGVMGQVARSSTALRLLRPRRRRPQADALLHRELGGHVGPGGAHRRRARSATSTWCTRAPTSTVTSTSAPTTPTTPTGTTVLLRYGVVRRATTTGALINPAQFIDGQGRLQDVEQRAAHQLAARQALPLRRRAASTRPRSTGSSSDYQINGPRGRLPDGDRAGPTRSG